MLGRPGTTPPATTTAGSRRPTSMSGTELLRQVKLAAAVTKASTLADVDRSTSKQGSSDSGPDEKENTMRPFLPCRLASFLRSCPCSLRLLVHLVIFMRFVYSLLRRTYCQLMLAMWSLLFFLARLALNALVAATQLSGTLSRACSNHRLVTLRSKNLQQAHVARVHNGVHIHRQRQSATRRVDAPRCQSQRGVLLPQQRMVRHVVGHDGRAPRGSIFARPSWPCKKNLGTEESVRRRHKPHNPCHAP